MFTLVAARRSNGSQFHSASYWVGLSEGSWVFVFVGPKGPDYGIIHWNLTRDDGYSVGEFAQTDMYDPVFRWSQVGLTISGAPTFTPSAAEQGRYVLTLSMDSQNASATGYYGALQNLLAIRVSTPPGDEYFVEPYAITGFHNPSYAGEWSDAITVDLATLAKRIRTATAGPVTLTDDDDVVLVNVPGGATVNLPTAVGRAGRAYDIKRLNAPPGSVTIAPTGGQTIDAAPSLIFTSRYAAATLISDGSNWWIL